VEVDAVDDATAAVVFDEAFDAQKRHPCHSVGAGLVRAARRATLAHEPHPP